MSEPIAPSIPTPVAITDAAKSSVGTCELPTGYLDEAGVLHKTAMLTEITGEEEDILMSKRMQAHSKMQKVLENCITAVGTVTAAGNRKWSDIVKNLVATDRLHALIHVRMTTLGAAYTFITKCPKCPDDEKPLSKVVDLNGYKISGMPDPHERTWKGVLPKSGLSFTCKVQTGVEEEKLAKASDATKDNMSLAMLARLLELGGQMPVTVGALKKLGGQDRAFLRDEFKKHEGLIDNEVEVTCDRCGHEFKTAIDVAQEGFFFPSGT